MAVDLLGLLLRTETETGLTTKGSNLDGTETDDNFLLFYQFMREMLAALNVEAYDGAKEYVTGDIVKYDSDLWKMINVSPQTGVEPSTDPLVWSITSVGQLIGNQAEQKYVTSLIIKKDGNTKLSEGEEGDGLLKIDSNGDAVMIQHDGSDFNPEKEFFNFSV